MNRAQLIEAAVILIILIIFAVRISPKTESPKYEDESDEKTNEDLLRQRISELERENEKLREEHEDDQFFFEAMVAGVLDDDDE